MLHTDTTTTSPTAADDADDVLPSIDVPKSIAELAREEVHTTKALAKISSDMERELSSFRRRYSALAAAHDDARRRLDTVHRSLCEARYHIDLVTMPESLLPWIHGMKRQLERREATDAPRIAPHLLNATRRGTRAPLLGPPPLPPAESREVNSSFLGNAARYGFEPMDVPPREYTERAVVPYRAPTPSEDTTVLFRSPISGNDVAVVRCGRVGGRALACKRSGVAAGDLLLCETPFFTFASDPATLASNGSLSPTLRRCLLESIASPQGISVMETQRWDPRLAVGVIALLGHWTRAAAMDCAAAAAAAHHCDAGRSYSSSSSVDSDDDRRSTILPSSTQRKANHTARRTFFSLACPMHDIEAAELNRLAKFASFVSTALPPEYRVFDDEVGGERRGAEHRAMRRGIGEEAPLSSHHRLALAASRAKKEEAGSGDPSHDIDAADSITMAPYDDDPMHRPVLLSPIIGPVLPDAAAVEGRSTAPSTEALPEWVRVSIEDVARIMLVLRCNLISDTGTAPGSGSAMLSAAMSDAATPGGVEHYHHLLWLCAVLEHSCEPNAIIVPHHAPNARSAVVSFGAQPGEEAPWCHGSALFELRALRAIDVGERISIAYVPTYLPRVQRLARLRRQYAFDCRCDAACGADRQTVDWPRSVIRRDRLELGVSHVPLLAPQGGGWISVESRHHYDAPDSDIALQLARVEAGWEALSGANDAVSEFEAIHADLLLLPPSSADDVDTRQWLPVAAVHYAPTLRFVRAVSLLVRPATTAAASEDIPVPSAAAFMCAAALLRGLHRCAAPTYPVLCSALARLLDSLPSVATRDEEMPIMSPPPQVTLEIYHKALWVVGPLLVDSIGALLCLHHRRSVPEGVWCALRDALETLTPSPNWAPYVRCCAAAADPSLRVGPPHLFIS